MKLMLSKDMFWITNLDLFQKQRQEGVRGYFTLVQNPTKTELRNGIYKPRLTLTKRFNTSGRHEATLSIEFSAPKLLYGNNFDEVTQDDYALVAEILQTKLKEMGVKVYIEILWNAPVSAVHYSKNIPLIDGTTPHYIISKMRNANVSLAVDVNETNYRNEGYSYKLHTNSYEIAFYDKIKELETAKVSEKRVIENDSILQLHLFDDLQKRKRLEVLRMEVRLNKRQKISQTLHSLDISSALTFKDLFNSAISQAVLLQVLQQLENRRLAIFDYRTTSPKTLLADIIMRNPKLGVRQKILIFGLKQAFEMVNPRELRAMFATSSQRSWQRLIADAKAVKLPISQSPFEVIRNCLNKFEPLKLVDFQNETINNEK